MTSFGRDPHLHLARRSFGLKLRQAGRFADHRAAGFTDPS
jgi:hypothetical protein